MIEWKNTLVKEVNEEDKRKYVASAAKSKVQRVISFFSHNNIMLMLARDQLDVEPASGEKFKIKWVPKNIEI